LTAQEPAQRAEPKDEASGIFWGWNGSLSGPGIYTTGGQEEIVIPGNNRATYNYYGHGASAGSGGSASVYGGVLVNVRTPEDYQGLTSAAGATVSVLGYGVTAGYFWNGMGSPFDIGSPKGYFLGYAPGAQLSIWKSSVYYQETWRYNK
jgi:hypothetical protein